jgi:hypothetical protein
MKDEMKNLLENMLPELKESKRIGLPRPAISALVADRLRRKLSGSELNELNYFIENLRLND